MSGPARALAFWIAFHADDDGSASLVAVEVARDLAVNERTVRRCLEMFERADWLDVERVERPWRVFMMEPHNRTTGSCVRLQAGLSAQPDRLSGSTAAQPDPVSGSGIEPHAGTRPSLASTPPLTGVSQKQSSSSGSSDTPARSLDEVDAIRDPSEWTLAVAAFHGHTIAPSSPAMIWQQLHADGFDNAQARQYLAFRFGQLAGENIGKRHVVDWIVRDAAAWLTQRRVSANRQPHQVGFTDELRERLRKAEEKGRQKGSG